MGKKLFLLFYLIIASVMIACLVFIVNTYINYNLSVNLIDLQFKTTKKQRIKNDLQTENLELNKIIKKNIFQVVQSSKEKEKLGDMEDKIEEIPVADVKDLELRGIVWSDKKENRIAIIYDKKMKLEGIYSIGDQITGGKVKDILKDQIVVTINGKDSRIILSDYTELVKGVNFTEQASYVISKKMLKSKLSDMPSLLRSMRVVPYTSKGIRGFKVVSIKDRFITDKLGLKKGDIILSVNGKDVTNMDNIMQLYSKVQDIEHVNLEILRNREKQSLSFTIK